MATQTYVLDESFVFRGTTDGGSPAQYTFYNDGSVNAIISPTHPVPAFTAVALYTGTEGVVCLAAAQYGAIIGITQEPITAPGQTVRVRTIGISKGRQSAAQITIGNPVCAADAYGRLQAVGSLGSGDHISAVREILGFARSTGTSTTADELVRVMVQPSRVIVQKT